MDGVACSRTFHVLSHRLRPALESCFLCGWIRDIQLGTGYAVWERHRVSHGPVACRPSSGNVLKGGRQGGGWGPLWLFCSLGRLDVT